MKKLLYILFFVLVTVSSFAQLKRTIDISTAPPGTDLSTYAKKQEIKDSVNRAVRNALDTTAFTLRSAAGTGTSLVYFPNSSTAVFKKIRCTVCDINDTTVDIGSGVKLVPVFDSIKRNTSPQFYYVVSDVNSMLLSALYLDPGNGDSLRKIVTKGYAFPSQISGYSYVNYTTVSDPDWSQNPAHTWWSPSFGTEYGVANAFTVGTAREYIAEYEGAANQLATLGLSADNTVENFFTFDYAVNVTGSNYNVYREGAVTYTSTVAVVPGDMYGLRLSAGGSIEAGYYRAGTWNSLYTFSGTVTGTLYLKGSTAYNNGNITKLLNPQYK